MEGWRDGGNLIASLAETALSALRRHNAMIFQRRGTLIEVKTLDDGTLQERPINTEKILMSHLRQCDLVVEEKELRHIATHILLHANLTSFQKLHSISMTPVFRPDFTLVPPGYDQATGIVYVPSPKIASHNFNTMATPEDAKEAYRTLQYPFSDFPFVSQPDRWNAIAFLLTVVARIALQNSLVPVLAVNANGQGAENLC